jgi:hypothetical protein
VAKLVERTAGAHPDSVRGAKRSAAVAALVLAPACVVLAATALGSAGWSFLSDALGPLANPSGALERAVSQVVVFGGPVVAAVVALWPVARLRFGHGVGRFAAGVSVRLVWWNLGIGVVGAALAVMLVGHLVADAVACSAGAASAC